MTAATTGIPQVRVAWWTEWLLLRVASLVGAPTTSRTLPPPTVLLTPGWFLRIPSIRLILSFLLTRVPWALSAVTSPRFRSVSLPVMGTMVVPL